MHQVMNVYPGIKLPAVPDPSSQSKLKRYNHFFLFMMGAPDRWITASEPPILPERNSRPDLMSSLVIGSTCHPFSVKNLVNRLPMNPEEPLTNSFIFNMDKFTTWQENNKYAKKKVNFVSK
jgi:hypothetical protein